MTKIIDKTEIKRLHEELDAVLAKFAEANGLTVSKFGLRFNATSFRTQAIDFAVKDGSVTDTVDPRYKRDLLRNGLLEGLDSSMIGTTLTLTAKRGQSPKYTFVGMRASKAVCINDGDRKPYLWDARFIAAQIKLQRKA